MEKTSPKLSRKSKTDELGLLMVASLNSCLPISLWKPEATVIFDLHKLTNSVFRPSISASVLSAWVDSYGLHPITPSTTVNMCMFDLHEV